MSTVEGPKPQRAHADAHGNGVRYLLAENFLETLDIYEQQAEVGGLWIPTPTNLAETPSAPQIDPLQPLQPPMWINGNPLFMTPLYDSLETNIPSNLMEFSDHAFPKECQLFPTRQEVLEYIQGYAADVKHLIQFQTQVFDLRLCVGGCDAWKLCARNLLSQDEVCTVYDAVAICSGHYTVPFIPNYPGITEWNGRLMHSKFYRSAEAFRDKKVLVVGNAASGSDISRQIAVRSRCPLLLSQRRASLFSAPSDSTSDPNIKVLPGIAEFINPSEADRSIRFSDGTIESAVDVVLFATGYLYNFPFLKSPELDMIDDGMRVKHMYQHMFHIEHPSLALLALPLKVLPFPLVEAQASVAARVWSRRLALPSAEKMRQWEATTLIENGRGRDFHVYFKHQFLCRSGTDPEQTLTFPKDFEYQQLLSDWSRRVDGKQPPRFDAKAAWARERFPAIKRAFGNKGEARHSIRTLEELGYNYETWLSNEDA